MDLDWRSSLASACGGSVTGPEQTRKIALITGADRGLGTDMALFLAPAGRGVVLTDGGGVGFIPSAADPYTVPGYGLYAACNGAIEVFTRYGAKAYGPGGVRSNTLGRGGMGA